MAFIYYDNQYYMNISHNINAKRDNENYFKLITYQYIIYFIMNNKEQNISYKICKRYQYL